MSPGSRFLVGSCVATCGAEFSIELLLKCINGGAQAVKIAMVKMPIMPQNLFISPQVQIFLSFHRRWTHSICSTLGLLSLSCKLDSSCFVLGQSARRMWRICLFWCLLDSAGGALGLWLIGYAPAYRGKDNNFIKLFVGDSGFFLSLSDIDLKFWCTSWCLFFTSFACFVLLT